MRGQSVLISGNGIAGPAVANWLLRYGCVPTMVEQAPAPRRSGHIIHLWGLGFDLVERMGLLPRVLAAGYRVREVRLVDRQERRTGGFKGERFEALTNGRYISLPPGALSEILQSSIDGRVESIFGDSISALEEDADGVLVHFRLSPSRRFDVVIAADGLHSTVRSLVFGPQSRFERFLGYTAAAFESTGYRPADGADCVGFAVPGQQIMRYSMPDDRTSFLLLAAESRRVAALPRDLDQQRAYLHRRFANTGWESDRVLAALGDVDTLSFDRVSQIHMDAWSKGRVALVGDAAFAPSLMAGQGAALALVSAYVLAGEMARATSSSGSVQDAFSRYEQLLRKFMLQTQSAAARFASSIAPRTGLGIFMRNQATRVLGSPLLARLAVGSSLVDDLELPDYSTHAAHGGEPAASSCPV
jgi:2-polyprenyl-6-methoxyphenol hydroxylase-like FAD-dependent oxidoreductase